MSRSKMCANAECGARFEPRRIGQKYCGPACASSTTGRNGAGGRARGRQRAVRKVALVCQNPACGRTFEVYPSQTHRRTCSPSCAAAVKGRPVGRSGSANPNYRKGRAAGKRPPARWRNAKGNRCEVPGCPNPRPGKRRLHLHHVVTRQVIRRNRGDQWDPAVGMTVCDSCHSKHHHRTRPIPRSAVPAAAVAYAVQLMGEDRAEDYIARYYSAGDRLQEDSDATDG